MFGFLRFGKQNQPDENSQHHVDLIELDAARQEQVEYLYERFTGVKDKFANWEAAYQKNIEEIAIDHPIVGQMIQSADFATKCLEHESSQVRFWALAALDAFHTKGATHVPIFEKMVRTEPNREVRIGAMMSLSTIIAFKGPPRKRRQLGRQFANMVLNNSEDVEIRKAAYMAICRLKEDDYDRFASSFEEIPSLEEIDWKYVRSWL